MKPNLYIIMSAVSDLHEKSIANARKWAAMLVDPADRLARAPSITPYLGSKTRFVRSVEIPYAETNNGAFAVAMLPDPNNSLFVEGPPRPTMPAVAGQITLATNEPMILKDGRAQSGLFEVSDATGNQLGTVTPLDTVIAGIPSTDVIPINITNGTALVICVRPSLGNPAYLRVEGVKATGDYQTLVVAYNLRLLQNGGTVYAANVPIALVGLKFTTVTSAGVVRSYPQSSMDMVIQAAMAQVAGGDFGSFSMFGSEITDVGSVSHVRATAMSMLVTNLAPPLEAGGELVIARTRRGILSNEDPLSLMDAVKRLPEQLYWRSGNIVDGAYSWYLPDQVSSYEPRPLDDPPPSDNVLVAAGVMANDGGYVRVICTWVFEFYSPAQLFERSYNLSWTKAHSEMLELLQQRSAVSANAGHVALISSIIALGTQAYSFYKANEQAIDALAKKGFNLGKSVAASVGKGSKGKSQAVGRAAPAAQAQGNKKK